MTVADTDVLIDFLNGRQPAANMVSGRLRAGLLWTTVITRYELVLGATAPRQKAAVTALLAAVPTLALEQRAADRAAGIGQRLRDTQAHIGMADCLIAGTVVTHGAELLTRNTRHFQRMEGLRLADLTYTSLA
jgi:tRNA(fMet)-specific endonuclease VapC